MIINNYKIINNKTTQKQLKSNSKATQKQLKSNSKATQKQMHQINNMSSFTMQIIIAANQINGIKRINSSIQYFASRK